MKRLVTFILFVLTNGVLVGMVIGLSGCQRSLAEANQYQQASAKMIEEKLPEGCSLKYLGKMDVGNKFEVLVPVIAVRCIGSDVVTTSDIRQNGKFQESEITVTIQDIEKRELELDSKKRQLQSAMSKLTDEEKRVLGLK